MLERQNLGFVRGGVSKTLKRLVSTITRCQRCPEKQTHPDVSVAWLAILSVHRTEDACVATVIVKCTGRTPFRKKRTGAAPFELSEMARISQ